MATTPYVVNDFGGLRTYGDQQDFGSMAVDIKNVRLDVPGRLVVRGGCDQMNATTNSDVVGFHRWDIDPTTFRVAVITDSEIEWYASAGSRTPLGTGAFSGSAIISGGPSYFARTDDVLLEIDAGVASDISGTPQATYLTSTGVEGRLVAAYADMGQPPNRDRVHFSAAGDVTDWGANDWVDLWPNDQQQIRAAVAFRDSVFVFKDRRFAVFYGESTDADGQPIFNYRPVDVGVGCAYDHGATVGPDGVYFIGARGIYRTVGDTPELISQDLQGVFDAATSGLYTGPTSISSPRIFAAPDSLYFVNNSQVFVYDFGRRDWSRSSYPAGVQFVLPAADLAPRSFEFVASDGSVYSADDSFTTDDGAAIAWLYTSGLYNLGDPARAAVTLESRVWGTGTVTFKVANDHGALDTGSALTLGTSPAVADAWQQIDREGTLWQHQFSGSGAASIHRLVHYVSFVKPVGVG